MAGLALSLRQRVARVTRHRFARYSLVSIVNVVLGQAILVLAFAGLHWTARASNVLATAVVTVPAYYLARTWVWRGRGRFHLVAEVLPFWLLAFAGLALSTWLAGVAEHWAEQVTPVRLEQTVIVAAGTLLAYGGIWVLRFVILNSLVFAGNRHPTLGATPVGVADDATGDRIGI